MDVAAPQGEGVLSEFWNLALLTTLYAMQGVPLGLTMGALCAPTPAVILPFPLHDARA